MRGYLCVGKSGSAGDGVELTGTEDIQRSSHHPGVGAVEVHAGQG